MPDDPAKLPRFPYIGALLCAACLGMAGYLWMRYSYCLALDSSDLHMREWSLAGGWPERAYGRLTGRPVEQTEADGWSFLVTNPQDPLLEITAVGDNPPPQVDADGLSSYRGRVERTPLVSGAFLTMAGGDLIFDTRSSRLTGESIAGLVVGAMGVFVFAVALRHWLRERARFREGARGA